MNGNVAVLVRNVLKETTKIGTELIDIVYFGTALDVLGKATPLISSFFRFLLIVKVKEIKIITNRLVFRLRNVKVY